MRVPRLVVIAAVTLAVAKGAVEFSPYLRPDPERRYHDLRTHTEMLVKEAYGTLARVTTVASAEKAAPKVMELTRQIRHLKRRSNQLGICLTKKQLLKAERAAARYSEPSMEDMVRLYHARQIANQVPEFMKAVALFAVASDARL